jgi:tellurite resistance protein
MMTLDLERRIGSDGSEPEEVMAQDPARHRPKMYPPPEFPPRQVPLFANTPPAIFPPILGLLGLVMALRVGSRSLGLGPELADLASGLVLPLWVFAACIYGVKMMRRISVINDDLKVMPSRAGLAAGTLGGMVVAAHLTEFSAIAGLWLMAAMLILHAVLVGLTVLALVRQPPEGRAVNPGWHMTFVGFIVAAPAAVATGQEDLARALFYATLPVALAIWAASLWQLSRRIPPAPLRPMLAIHLAPASLLSITASLIGLDLPATIFAWTALVIVLALAAALRWITAAGFSPLWGAFTFPLAAASTALMLQGAALGWAGLALLALGLVAIPWIALRILKLWPGGRLAARTNAAEA